MAKPAKPKFPPEWRYYRRHDKLSQKELEERFKAEGDLRSLYCKDRDKLLYSGFFSRLSGVAQIVSPSLDHFGDFHNRLTHSLEVAQIARRLAEKVNKTQPHIIAKLGEVSPDVAETAALAHDLGHPPFGHDGERVLHELMSHYPEPGQNPSTLNYGGFNGNAQSFRILAVLETAEVNEDGDRIAKRGLNLTRATLASVIKYPWHVGATDKFGIYSTVEDSAAFQWCKEGIDLDFRTPEAEIMDFADDVVYSVVDVCDFVAQNRLDISSLASVESLKALIEDDTYSRYKFSEVAKSKLDDAPTRKILSDTLFGNALPYSDSFEFFMFLKHFKNKLLGILTGDDQKLLSTIGASDPFQLTELQSGTIDGHAVQRCARIDPMIQTVIELLKKLTADETHRSSQVTERQYTMALCLRSLVRWVRHQILEYLDGVNHNAWLFGPYSDMVESIRKVKTSGEQDSDKTYKGLAARLACDIVSGWSDAKAYQMYTLFAHPWSETFG